MKKLVLTLGASLLIMQTEALLPPLYQTSIEIRTILADEQLSQKLQVGEVLEKVEKNSQGYEITTNHHYLQISVIYETVPGPGPAHFKLHFGEPVRKN